MASTVPAGSPIGPIPRFVAALETARALGADRIPEPTAFTLATVGDDGRPSSRVVLLKGVDEAGFVFYTNFESRKGRELTSRPYAAICFHWAHLETQIRIEGPVARVSDEEADAYFATRPRGSQIGAWASRQSRPLANAEELHGRVASYEKEFEGRPVTRPPYWSGFRLSPDRIEFWKGQPSRLHDRERYVRDGDVWRVERLYP